MFKVAGVSTLNGKTKVRFANDMVSRVKILVKDGHQDINLFELPEPMSKGDVVKYLSTLDSLTSEPKFAHALSEANEKYNGLGVVRVNKTEISLEAIKARAGIEA